MEDIIESVKRHASNTGENGHQELMDGLRKLSYSLETPRDTIQRLGFAHLETAAVRIGIDLKIFDLLITTNHPLTVAELHQVTEVSPLLLGRILRCLASVGTIEEVEMDSFTSTNLTRTLATPGVQAGIYHQFHTCGPMYQELPEFLSKNNYSDITDNYNTVHQVAHKTTLPTYLWLDKHPRAASHLNKYMRYHSKKQAICWDVYPVEQETQGWDPDVTVLVDVGGHLGQVSATFKRKFPKVLGQVVLQEAQEMIDMVSPVPGVKNMVHDIFDPQPITGARYYYLRFILHDWPDKECRLILINIINAMSPASHILIDEMVLPDTRAHWRSTSTDLTAMAAMGARERTRTQWAELLDSVGLVIEAVRTYLPIVEQSIMTVGRKQ